MPAFYECLVRMEQDDGQFLLAPDIVPVAEKLGLIRLVDHRVLELVVAELAAVAGRAAQPQHLARHHDGSGLVGLDRIADARPSRRRRAADRRDHRNRCDPGHRRRPRLRHPAEEFRQQDRDRRFRRRLHLVPESAQARRRYRENRRRLRAEHRALGRRSRLRADADRSGAPARHQDRRRMGAGRGIRRRCCATGAATTSRAG